MTDEQLDKGVVYSREGLCRSSSALEGLVRKGNTSAACDLDVATVESVLISVTFGEVIFLRPF